MAHMSGKRPSEAALALQFNVAQLLKQATGARRGYDIAVEAPELDQQLLLVGPLHGQVACLRIGAGILVTGELETVVRLECVRCLTEFDLPIRVEIEEEFRPTIDIVTGLKVEQEPDQDQATLIDEQHILDLAEVIRQAVWLEIPSSPICQPDCKGLCPQCGQNRNQVECSCQSNTVDARWVALLATRGASGT
jgi:uncharacterized protein